MFRGAGIDAPLIVEKLSNIAGKRSVDEDLRGKCLGIPEFSRRPHRREGFNGFWIAILDGSNPAHIIKGLVEAGFECDELHKFGQRRIVAFEFKVQ